MAGNLVAGDAFAGVIIADLFGYAPDGFEATLTDPCRSCGLTGRLRRRHFTVTSGPHGLGIACPDHDAVSLTPARGMGHTPPELPAYKYTIRVLQLFDGAESPSKPMINLLGALNP